MTEKSEKNRWITDLHWRKEGQQTRSEKTQNALIDAAEALILEKGTEATSIADIAKKAGSSVGSVYHHFKDKKALFYALFHRMTERYEALNAQASDPAQWEGATVEDLLRGYLELSVTAFAEKAEAKAAVSAVVADHPELASHYAEIQKRGNEILCRLLLERKMKIGSQDAELKIKFIIDQINAMIRARMDRSAQMSALSKLSDQAFVAQAMAMAKAYLEI